jgi:hypothetical protein
MEETIRDLKGNLYRLQLENLSSQQISAVKSLLQKSEITPALVASVVSAIKQAEGQGPAGCGGSCGSAGGGASIRTLAPTCPGAKYVGQVITLSSTPTGGIAPYTVTFRRSGVALPSGSFTNVPEGTLKTMNYTLVAADSPSVVMSVYITDSCPSGSLNNTEQCTITTGVCAAPSCGFVVA